MGTKIKLADSVSITRSSKQNKRLTFEFLESKNHIGNMSAKAGDNIRVVVKKFKPNRKHIIQFTSVNNPFSEDSGGETIALTLFRKKRKFYIQECPAIRVWLTEKENKKIINDLVEYLASAACKICTEAKLSPFEYKGKLMDVKESSMYWF